MQDHKLFADLLADCCLVFDKDITVKLADIYWKVLKRFSDKEVSDAFEQAIKKCRFFPKPAELIEFIEGSREEWVPIKLEDTMGKL